MGNREARGKLGAAWTPFVSLLCEGSSYLQSTVWPDHSGAAFDAELKGESTSHTSNGFGRGIWVSESLNHPPTHPLCTSLGKAGQQGNPGPGRDTSLELGSRNPSLPPAPEAQPPTRRFSLVPRLRWAQPSFLHSEYDEDQMSASERCSVYGGDSRVTAQGVKRLDGEIQSAVGWSGKASWKRPAWGGLLPSSDFWWGLTRAFSSGLTDPRSGLLRGPWGPGFGAVGGSWTDLVPNEISATAALGELLRPGPQFAHLNMGIPEFRAW